MENSHRFIHTTGALSICTKNSVIPMENKMELAFPPEVFRKTEKDYLRRYSSFLVFTEIIGKSLHLLFHGPTSTMNHDERCGFCRLCLLLQIVEPRLSQKKSQLCAKGTRSSPVPFCLRKKSYCSF